MTLMNRSERLTLRENLELSEKGKKKESLSLSKLKREDSFSKVLKDKAQEQDQIQDREKTDGKEKEENSQREFVRVEDLERELSPLRRFLYDLVYRDPSTWSLGDKARYGLDETQKHGQGRNDFLSAQEGQPRNLGEGEQSSALHADFRRDLFRLLDLLSSEILLSSEQGSSVNSGKGFAKNNSSLEELAETSQAERSKLFSEMVRQFSIRKLKEGAEADLELDPKTVGDLRLLVQIQKNKITAVFKTKSQSVCNLLKEHLDELNQALAKRGLVVKSLEVKKEEAS